MPYASDKQRKFMYSQKPEIAKKFEKEGKAGVVKKAAKKAAAKKSGKGKK